MTGAVVIKLNPGVPLTAMQYTGQSRLKVCKCSYTIFIEFEYFKRGMAVQAVQCLPCKCKALSSNSHTTKTKKIKKKKSGEK
jgi:hypothetical protein